ncbi:hypothetical protein Tco_1424569 [Tanacetum coccineum]
MSKFSEIQFSFDFDVNSENGGNDSDGDDYNDHGNGNDSDYGNDNAEDDEELNDIDPSGSNPSFGFSKIISIDVSSVLNLYGIMILLMNKRKRVSSCQ